MATPTISTFTHSLTDSRLAPAPTYTCIGTVTGNDAYYSTLTSLGFSTLVPVFSSCPTVQATPSVSVTTVTETHCATIGHNITSNSSGTSTHPAEAASAGSGGISTGAIAGASVGAAIGGLLAGFVAAFLFLKNRKGKSRNEEPLATFPIHSEAKDLGSGNDVSAAAAGKVQLDRFLLEATPDQDIVREVQCLGGLIHQHVEAHYHLRETSSSDRDVAATLVALGFPDDGLSSLTAQEAASLCVNPATRQVGLRHVILRALFQSIDWQRPGPVVLLPDAAAAFIQRVPASDSQSQSNHEAVTIATAKWRKLSAFLLHPQRSQRTPLSRMPTAETDAKVERLTGLLNTFLGFFMEQDARLHQEQANHLRGVIAECAKLGYLLFSQPSDFRLLTGHESGRDKSSRSHSDKARIIVEAGLDKVSYHEEDGAVYPSVTHLLEPTFAATGV